MNEIEVDGRRLHTALGRVTAADVAALAGLVPPDAHLFVRIDGGAARRMMPDEGIAIDGEVPRLRSGQAPSTWTLVVDGVRWDWAAPAILASELREVAGLPVDQPLRVDDDAEPVREGGLVDLTAGERRVSSRGAAQALVAAAPGLAPGAPALRPAVPQLPRAAPAILPRGVPVVINGRPRELANPDATFEDLVRLAFPDLPVAAGQTYTVTYRRGGAARPEGALVPHQAARLAPGAVINVSATNRS